MRSCTSRGRAFVTFSRRRSRAQGNDFRKIGPRAQVALRSLVQHSRKSLEVCGSLCFLGGNESLVGAFSGLGGSQLLAVSSALPYFSTAVRI